MLIELRCATHGGAREGAVPGNLNSEPNEDSGKQGVIVPLSSAKAAPIKKKLKKISSTRIEITKNSSLRVFFFFFFLRLGQSFCRITVAVVLNHYAKPPCFSGAKKTKLACVLTRLSCSVLSEEGLHNKETMQIR